MNQLAGKPEPEDWLTMFMFAIIVFAIGCFVGWAVST